MKGHATIVQAGTDGNISVWSEHDTQLVSISPATLCRMLRKHRSIRSRSAVRWTRVGPRDPWDLPH